MNIPTNKRQFLKYFYACGIPRNDLNYYIELVKKYKGRLSYFRMCLMMITAIGFGKRGEEILSYIDVVMSSEAAKCE